MVVVVGGAVVRRHASGVVTTLVRRTAEAHSGFQAAHTVPDEPEEHTMKSRATANWTRRLVASGLVAGSFLFAAGPANALPAPQGIHEGVSRPALVEATTQTDVRVADTTVASASTSEAPTTKIGHDRRRFKLRDAGA